MNKIDSALTYILKSEELILLNNGEDVYEDLKELNLLKSIYYIKKSDYKISCQYFKQYIENEHTDIFSNFIIYEDLRYKNWEDAYFSLFKDDITQIKKYCD